MPKQMDDKNDCYKIKCLSVGWSKRHFNLCAPEGSRTPNLLIRSQVLYPIKLQVPFLTECKNMLSFQTNISFFQKFTNQLKLINLLHSFYSTYCFPDRIKIRKICSQL